MIIPKISYLYNVPFLKKQGFSRNMSLPSMNTMERNNNLIKNDLEKGDVVSFTGKKYNKDDILNPTNHCAYCGCKVYDEQQIDSLAKEMCASKAGRLDGKIKSVLEKLTEAKNSQDLTLAKKIENEEEIKFFNKFLELSSNKPYLRGEEILGDSYSINFDEVVPLLTKNMQPLLKTVDHVSPQNLEQENTNSDINLVESCYCCNHDIKNGMNFSQFYGIFPEIIYNMPKEKFQYASANLLDSSSNVRNHISYETLLKILKRLFIQKQETEDMLYSIDKKIQDCKSSVTNSIESCESEMANKQTEIAGLKMQLTQLQNDPEYKAINERIALNEQLKNIDNSIVFFENKRQDTSNQINQIRNSQTLSKNKQQKNKQVKAPSMSKEEADLKVDELKLLLETCSLQIKNKEDEKLKIQSRIEELNEQYPTLEILKSRKNEAERIYNSHISLNSSKEALAEKKEKYFEMEKEQKSLETFIEEQNNFRFNEKKYPAEDKSFFERYKKLEEAVQYIEKHKNSGGIKLCINEAAKVAIDAEMKQLQSIKMVADYKNSTDKQKKKKELQVLLKEKEILKKEISNLENEIALSSKMPQQEALERVEKYSELIERTTEKQNYTDLQKDINKLEAEIILLKSTIEKFEDMQKDIDSVSKE